MSVAVWHAVQRTKQLQERQEDIIKVLEEQVFGALTQEEQGSFRQYLSELKRGNLLQNSTNVARPWTPGVVEE
jgi:hypothetical protein